MIIEIQHETRLQYSEPVAEWVAEFRVEPVSDENQSCQTFFLGISQSTPVNRYLDGLGNRVHSVNLLSPHLEVKILAASIVQTHPRKADMDSSRSLWPLAESDCPLETADAFQFRGPVRRSESFDALAAELAPQPGDRILDHVMKVSRSIFERFEYAKAVTQASSPIDDVLKHGKGVCQDFAHLMIGLLRSASIPARYVSGYIHRVDKESQSHAWVEAWVPDRGWIGIDPTNNVVIDDRFVKVAIGRDFTDVPPNKGVYRGSGREHILARVETRELDRLPTLSWREQLPPLHVPLVEVLSQMRRQRSREDDADDQQQQ